jgi:hypothetical protein
MKARGLIQKALKQYFEDMVRNSDKDCRSCSGMEIGEDGDIDDEGRGRVWPTFLCRKHYDEKNQEDRIERVMREYKPISLSLNHFKIVANICEDFEKRKEPETISHPFVEVESGDIPF